MGSGASKKKPAEGVKNNKEPAPKSTRPPSPPLKRPPSPEKGPPSPEKKPPSPPEKRPPSPEEKPPGPPTPEEPDKNGHHSDPPIPASPTPEDNITSPEPLNEPDVPTTVEEFQAFVEFPTPHLLREANASYAKLGRPIPLSEDGRVIPYPVPSPKTDVFNMDKYDKVDQFALQVDVSSYRKNIQEFTEYLTDKFKDDQMAVARVIFRWLAAQDIDKFAKSNTDDPESTEWHLKRLLSSPGDYNTLFLKMCNFAGIQGKVIMGYAKHANMQPGQEPSTEDLNSWVGVVINAEWRLIDPHWGSSHMVGGDPGEWLLIDDNGQGMKNVDKGPSGTAYAYNEVYFLTDPEQYIYSHFPKDDKKLQFLARPVTLREFTEMAYLKPGFFDLGLKLREHRKCQIHASEGEIEIEIGTPHGKPRSFMYRLWMSNKQSVDDIKLDRFCIMQQKNDTLFCRIYFPVAGKFKFELYGKDAAEESKDGSSFHKQLCAYIIHVDKPAEGVKAFPENARREWGPGPELEAAGLRPITHDDALIEAEDGTAIVRFKIDRAVEILHNLHSNTLTKEDLKNQMFHYMDHAKGECVLYIKLPESGDYALNLFAKDQGSEGSLKNICSYIVSCENPASDPRPYPKVINGRIGPLVNSGVELKLISHDSPLIQCPESGELDVEFECNVAVDTMTGLELHTKNGNITKEDFVWTNYHDKKVKYNIRFPEPGMYALNVFGKEDGSDGGYSHAYTCLVNVPIPKESCVPFPKAFAQWRPGCKIMDPQSNLVPANSKVKFQAVIPHASQVAAISNNGWAEFTKNEEGVWSADVDTPNPGEAIKLSAEVDEGSGNYTTLLTYQTEEASDLEKEEEKQQQLKEAARKENEANKLKEQKELQKRQKDFENAKEALLKAIESRDIIALRKAVKAMEKKKYVSKLPEEIEKAKKLIKSLERIQKLKQAILKLDQNTMLEIKNYSKPPKLVHEVMIATLLLLGDTEKDTKEWSELQKRLVTIGKDGLHRRVTNFDVTNLHPEIASRALAIIGKYRLDDVSDVSSGAGTFYAWTVGMIEEVRVANPDAHSAPPANISRQKEIFSKQSKNK